MLRRFLTLMTIADVSLGRSFLSQGVSDVVGGGVEAVAAVLGAASQPGCSLILLTDGTIPPYTVFKVVAPWGVGVFEVAADGQDANVTQEQLSQVVGQARRLRQLSWCVRVVVVSDDPAFLAAFAQWSLKGRLLGRTTKLLAVTRLSLFELKDLISTHWTFSMMNTMFLIQEDTPGSTKSVVYSYLPYGAGGAETVPVASWSPATGLIILSHQRLFPLKFSNFHGATVNVTGLPWAPYFIVYDERAADGTRVKNYKGADGLLFRTIANTLNFTFKFLPSNGWIHAADQVAERKSYMLVVSHVLLHTRFKRFEYTYTYAYISFGFGMAKPLLQPQWLSLYYPLADQVWASTLATLLLMPAIMYMVSLSNKWKSDDDGIGRENLRPSVRRYRSGGESFVAITQEVLGTLLGQNLSKWLPRQSSNRIVMAAWLVFAFIIGTVYRGNLTAALTLPKYPPRPETVEQLVDSVERVTIPGYGEDWLKQFRVSGASTLVRLAQLMEVGPTIQEGLQQALEKLQAHLCARQVFEYWAAGFPATSDGSSPLYFGRETLLPGSAAWPIPHDAPYRTQLDNIMMAVKEAGLYDKWTKDTLDETRKENRRKRQKKQEEEEEAGQASKAAQPVGSSRIQALTIVHMQGPLLLLLLGLVFAGFVFTAEMFKELWCH